VQAEPAKLGTVPVGQTQTTTLSISVSRNVTVTGPVSASGEDSLSALEAESRSGRHSSASTAGVKTAGPAKLPPAVTAPVSAGVISVQQPWIGSAIAAGTTMRLHVRFTPDRAGPVVGTIAIHTSAGTRTVPVSGYGAKPGLVSSAQPLTFGTVRAGGEGRSLSLTFSNSWDHPEILTGVGLPAAPYRVSGLPQIGTILPPRRAITVSVQFDPSKAGKYDSILRIDTNHGALILPATGIGVRGSPRLTVSAKRIDVGSVPVGQTKSVTFYVRDASSVPVTITRAIAPIGEFWASVPLSEGIVIGRGVSAAVTVTFHPTARGPVSGAYILAGNDGKGYVRVTFTGSGV
jgi:hypothetical protein